MKRTHKLQSLMALGLMPLAAFISLIQGAPLGNIAGALLLFIYFFLFLKLSARDRDERRDYAKKNFSVLKNGMNWTGANSKIIGRIDLEGERLEGDNPAEPTDTIIDDIGDAVPGAKGISSLLRIFDALTPKSNIHYLGVTNNGNWFLISEKEVDAGYLKLTPISNDSAKGYMERFPDLFEKYFGKPDDA